MNGKIPPHFPFFWYNMYKQISRAGNGRAHTPGAPPPLRTWEASDESLRSDEVLLRCIGGGFRFPPFPASARAQARGKRGRPVLWVLGRRLGSKTRAKNKGCNEGSKEIMDRFSRIGCAGRIDGSFGMRSRKDGRRRTSSAIQFFEWPIQMTFRPCPFLSQCHGIWDKKCLKIAYAHCGYIGTSLIL